MLPRGKEEEGRMFDESTSYDSANALDYLYDEIGLLSRSGSIRQCADGRNHPCMKPLRKSSLFLPATTQQEHTGDQGNRIDARCRVDFGCCGDGRGHRSKGYYQ